MNHRISRQIALSGLLAAVAVVIMCLGGVIPVATYICPMLCCMTLELVLWFCGKKIGWTWFTAVAIISLLMGPDKEAAIVFLAIGYYPLLKPGLDKLKVGFLLKILYFNTSVFLVYGVMIHLLGMEEVAAENAELGIISLLLILILGNVTFFLLDKLLTIMTRKLR